MFDNNTIAFITFILFVLTFGPFIKWFIKRNEIWKLIEKFPGPKAYPLIGTTYIFFGKSRKDIFDIIDKRTRKYPKLSRVWLGTTPEIRISLAEYVEPILNSSKHIDKSIIYTFIKSWLGEGLLTSSGDRWHRHRKIITPTFHFTILESFCEIFSEQSNVLVNKLEKYADTGKVVDVYPFITKAALDIICDAAMGIQINAQDEDESNYVKAVYDITELLMRRLIRPWLHSDIIYRYSNDGKQFQKCLNILNSFADNVIQERKQAFIKQQFKEPKKDKEFNSSEHMNKKKKRLAFLDLLLETSLQTENSLTDLDIREEVSTFMFEGHDTTTAGISWALYLIGLHPEIQENIYDEIYSIFGESDRNATLQDLMEMKYLECVIKETLRLFPSVPFIGRVLTEDIELENNKVPAGCMIAIQIYHLHRDERYFPDPEKFDPDRFLPINANNRHPFAYLPFSAGPRNCIGQRFALLEEKSVLSCFLRKFKIKSVEKREDIILVNELILRPFGGTKLILEKRIKPYE